MKIKENITSNFIKDMIISFYNFSLDSQKQLKDPIMMFEDEGENSPYLEGIEVLNVLKYNPNVVSRLIHIDLDYILFRLFLHL